MRARFKKTVVGKNTTLKNNKRALFKLTMVSVCGYGYIKKQPKVVLHQLAVSSLISTG